MNPETNRFELLNEMTPKQRAELEKQFGSKLDGLRSDIVRADGSPVPKTWAIFRVGELVEIKGYTFKVGHISDSTILFEPVSPIIQEARDEQSD